MRAIYSGGITLNNKIYFGSSDNNVYEYGPATGIQKNVIQTNGGGGIDRSGVVLNNKIYIGSRDGDVYEYDPITEQQRIVITTNKPMLSSGVILNNKLYIGSDDHNVYEYDPTTGQQKVVIKTKGAVFSNGIVLNNKIYFGSHDHNVYEYDPNYYNLGQINDNSNDVILNELNYLNYDLNISRLKIISKTDALVIIKSKDNKYFGEFTVNYKIKNKDEINIINLNELIKKAIFFKFRNYNPNLIFKEIRKNNTNNLSFGTVEMTKNKELDWSVNFKDVCFTKKPYKSFPD